MWEKWRRRRNSRKWNFDLRQIDDPILKRNNSVTSSTFIQYMTRF